MNGKWGSERVFRLQQTGDLASPILHSADGETGLKGGDLVWVVNDAGGNQLHRGPEPFWGTRACNHFISTQLGPGTTQHPPQQLTS
ncbi:hypothetical protein AAY473_029799 [Plecturocebus cupreus]